MHIYMERDTGEREAEKETYVSLDACTLCICKYHILQNLYSDV